MMVRGHVDRCRYDYAIKVKGQLRPHGKLLMSGVFACA